MCQICFSFPFIWITTASYCLVFVCAGAGVFCFVLFKFDEWVFDEMFVHLFRCLRIEMDFNFMSDEALLMSVICSNWLNNEWPLCKCVRVHAKARVYVDSNRHEPSVHNLFPYFFSFSLHFILVLVLDFFFSFLFFS